MDDMNRSVTDEDLSASTKSQFQSGVEKYVKTTAFADMKGQQYEYKMAALLYLRCLFMTEGFHIAANFEGVGAFDDLVLRIRYKKADEEKVVTCFIQLKYKKKKNAEIDKRAFFKRNSDFSLSKYFDSFLKIQERFQNPEEADPPFNGSFEDCVFILFSNTTFLHNTPAIPKRKGTYTLMDKILNTNGSEHSVFSFSENDAEILKLCEGNLEQYKVFLSNLLFYHKQANISKLDNLISDEILLRSNTSEKVISYMFSFLDHKIQDWWQNQTFFLTELAPYWRQCVEPYLSDMNTSISLHKLGVKFDQEKCTELQKCINTPGLTSVNVKDIDPKIRCLKLHQILEKYFHGAFLMLSVSDAHRRLPELLSAYKNGLCEVLCVDTEDCVEKTLALLTELSLIMVKNSPKLILISGQRKDFFTANLKYKVLGEYEDDWMLDQFDKKSQDFILNQKLHFQGHEVCLQSLIAEDVNLRKKFCGKVLSDLLCSREKLCIGSKLEVELDCYIPRFLKHDIVIKKDILRGAKDLNDIFLETGITWEEVEDNHQMSKVIYTSFVVILFYSIDLVLYLPIMMRALLSNTIKFTKICKSYSDKSVHLLQKERDYLTWIKSPGDTNITSRHMQHRFTSCKFDGNSFCMLSDECLLDCSEKLILITGDPGIGKSVLLTHIAHEIKLKNPLSWVIKIYLNDISNVLDKTNIWTLETVISTLCDIVMASTPNLSCVPVTRHLMENALLETGNVYILLDAVDEISPVYTQKVFEIVQILLIETKVCKLFMSSRLMIQTELDKHITHATTFSVQPFSVENQRKYLEVFWRKQLLDSLVDDKDLVSFVNYVLDFASRHLVSEGKLFLSNPQNLRMLAETCVHDMQAFVVSKDYTTIPHFFNLAQLYANFIELKLAIYYKKYNVDLSKVVNTSARKINYEKFIELHMLCALVTMLTPEELDTLHDKNISKMAASILEDITTEKTGIIDGVINGKPNFIHMTYCEYFTALWFLHHYKLNREVLSEILFQPKFQFMRYIFNQKLSGDFKLHAAIPFLNLKEIGDDVDVNVRDKGGRTALHLAASYNRVPLAKTLLDKGCDITAKDDVFQWTALHYAKITETWDIVSLLSVAGCDDEDMDIVMPNQKIVISSQ